MDLEIIFCKNCTYAKYNDCTDSYTCQYRYPEIFGLKPFDFCSRAEIDKENKNAKAIYVNAEAEQ